MKTLMTLATALVLSAGAAFADPVEGLWKTQPGDDGNYGHIKVSTCGVAICGVIQDGFDSSGKSVGGENIGKRMLWDMGADGDGEYSGGKIWAPDRDKTYNSKMTLSGKKLKVSGCVFGICRSQTWARVK
jgi:uncharacterized protein (DUF2147 family)